jgi:hypothetical protein
MCELTMLNVNILWRVGAKGLGEEHHNLFICFTRAAPHEYCGKFVFKGSRSAQVYTAHRSVYCD